MSLFERKLQDFEKSLNEIMDDEYGNVEYDESISDVVDDYLENNNIELGDNLDRSQAKDIAGQIESLNDGITSEDVMEYFEDTGMIEVEQDVTDDQDWWRDQDQDLDWIERNS